MPLVLCQGSSFVVVVNFYLFFLFYFIYTYFPLVFTLQSLCVYIMASVYCFYWIPECKNEWVSISCVFYWTLFFLFAYFVQFKYVKLCFIILHFITPPKAYLFSNGTQKEGWLQRVWKVERSWED